MYRNRDLEGLPESRGYTKQADASGNVDGTPSSGLVGAGGEKAKGFTHDKKDNATVDWWTPKYIFDALNVEFDMDVAAPSGGVPWIPAKRSLSREDDGLLLPWVGRVWLNPPYGKQTPDWLEKMHNHRNGIALVFARTDCRWFHDFVCRADGILLLRGRIAFVDGLQKTGGGGAGAGSMLVAWGADNLSALRLASTKLLGKLIDFAGGGGAEPVSESSTARPDSYIDEAQVQHGREGAQ